MLNHKFDLMNQTEQKLYFSNDISRVLDNSVAFDTGKIYAQSSDDLYRSSMVPYFKLVAKTQINRMFRSVLRPVERDLARTIGLYDITLDYNLGSGVNEALGLSKTAADDSSSMGTGTETVLGINVVENLISDRLFITLKTEIQRQQESDVTSVQLSKYAITYYLTSWLTVNYRNKQDDPQEPLKGSMSLEASLAF